MTPEQFYAKYLHQYAQENTKLGAQCVWAFKLFCKENSIPVVPTPDNRASGYWTCQNQDGTINENVKAWQEKYFDKITDKSKFRNGDWVIWGWNGSHAQTHIAMWIGGKSFSLNQYEDYKNFTAKDTDFSDALGALRWKGYKQMAEIMNGIDISNWQKGLNLNNIDFDFVICKATEGIGFVDPYCDQWVQQAIALGKPWGFYHFMRPTNDPVKEAQFFVENTSAYFGKGLPVLDVEVRYGNIDIVDWCYKFLSEVIRLTGIKPLVYMSEQSFEWAYDWSKVVSLDCGLWCAAYRTGKEFDGYGPNAAGQPPRPKNWPFVCMWQYTSKGRLNGWNGYLDFDVFYGGRKVWDAYVTSKNNTAPDTDDKDKQIAELEKKVAMLKNTMNDITDTIQEALKELRI